MKKLLSVILALVMSITTLFAIPATAHAEQKYDDSVTIKNIDFIKNYIRTNGFINGNGEYTLQHSGVVQSIRYYGLLIVKPSDNTLVFDYQRCDAYDDTLYNVTSFEIKNAPQDMYKVWVDFWIMGNRYSDLSGYAYIDRNFNHNTQKPVFYIENNETSYPEYKAKEMCEENFTYAFNEWSYMMDEMLGMDLSAVGFRAYCQKHVYGYGGTSCMMCGAVKEEATTANTNNNSNATASDSTTTKLKATALSKVTAGKKQFKLTWKAVSGVSSYQIQYSTDKKFKKGNKSVTVKGAKKTSVTVKKLKSKKTYYVRIRTCKNGKYSAWSKAKAVKVK